MNEFLNEIWFGNTVRNYLIVVAIILFILLVRRYLARYVAHLIFHFVSSIWKSLDKKTFINLVVKPLGFFLAILVSVIALYKLHFPARLNEDIYRITIKELFHGLGSLILIASFIRLLLRMIDFLAIILHARAESTPDPTDNQLVYFFKDFFKVMLVIIGLLMILKFSFGFNIGNLLTGLSIVGAAIALALRESLENLIASFIIFFDRPFSAGDIVKVHNFTGTVEKIGLRSTRIRTDQKTFITVPNKQMVDSILDNHSQRTQRKGELKLEVRLSTPATVLDQLVSGVRQILQREEIENATVLLSDITPSAYQITADYFTGPVIIDEFNAVKEQVNFAVIKLMEELKVEIVSTSTDVRIVATPA